MMDATNNPKNYKSALVVDDAPKHLADGTEGQPTETPNKVVKNVNARKTLNLIVSTLAIGIATVMVVDLASEDFDLSRFTVPAAAGITYLAGVFNVAVTFPNYPK